MNNTIIILLFFICYITCAPELNKLAQTSDKHIEREQNQIKNEVIPVENQEQDDQEKEEEKGKSFITEGLLNFQTSFDEDLPLIDYYKSLGNYIKQIKNINRGLKTRLLSLIKSELSDVIHEVSAWKEKMQHKKQTWIIESIRDTNLIGFQDKIDKDIQYVSENNVEIEYLSHSLEKDFQGFHEYAMNEIKKLDFVSLFKWKGSLLDTFIKVFETYIEELDVVNPDVIDDKQVTIKQVLQSNVNNEIERLKNNIKSYLNKN